MARKSARIGIELPIVNPDHQPNSGDNLHPAQRAYLECMRDGYLGKCAAAHQYYDDVLAGRRTWGNDSPMNLALKKAIRLVAAAQDDATFPSPFVGANVKG